MVETDAGRALSTTPETTQLTTAERWELVWKRVRFPVLGLAGFLVFGCLWQLTATSGLVDKELVGSPIGVLKAIGPYFGKDGTGFSDLAVSAKEFAWGFAFALVAGLLIGVILGIWPTINDMFQPLISFLNAAPHIALVPMLVLLFGIGIWSKVAVVFISAIFSIVINTQSGVALADVQLTRVARSFGASRVQALWAVRLPSAVPVIVAGIRIAIGRGLVGMVVGELIASTAGLGYTIGRAGNTFQTDLMLLSVAIIATISVLVTAVLRQVEKRLDRWRPVDN